MRVRTRSSGSQPLQSEAPDCAPALQGKHERGSQAVERALRILSLVLERRESGIRLIEIARLADIHVATAHRLLKALVRERMVSFDGYQKKYYLGLRLTDLTKIVPEDILDPWCRSAQVIAAATGDTVYLYARSGLDIVCVDRVEGAYPIRALIREIGSHIPIGASAGSTHMLANMPAEEATHIVRMNAERFAAFRGLSAEEVWAEVLSARVRGFGVNDNRVLPGVSSVGVAMLDHEGVPWGCISVSALCNRLDASRRRWVVDRICQATRDFDITQGLPAKCLRSAAPAPLNEPGWLNTTPITRAPSRRRS